MNNSVSAAAAKRLNGTARKRSQVNAAEALEIISSCWCSLVLRVLALPRPRLMSAVWSLMGGMCCKTRVFFEARPDLSIAEPVVFSTVPSGGAID
jgi:hypothetical protein